jgi:hypothetical protein
MIKPRTVTALMGLNAGLIGRTLDNVNVAGFPIATRGPSKHTRPRSPVDEMNNNVPSGIAGALPIRSRSTPGQQDK